MVDPPESPRRLAVRAVRHFRAQVEDWYDECRALTDWEDENLVDDPTPERLGEHARNGWPRSIGGSAMTTPGDTKMRSLDYGTDRRSNLTLARRPRA